MLFKVHFDRPLDPIDPQLQVESKFSYALELVNLEQQKEYYEIQK